MKHKFRAYQISDKVKIFEFSRQKSTLRTTVWPHFARVRIEKENVFLLIFDLFLQQPICFL